MITKAEAVSKLTAEETAEFRMWEARIDSALRTHNGRDMRVNCRCFPCANLHREGVRIGRLDRGLS
jgi:hypothetical protein